MTPVIAAQAADSLVGRVVDEYSRAPVRGMTVALERSDGSGLAEGFEAVTDVNGSFLLLGVPSGVHVVRVEHIDYGARRHMLKVEGSGSARIEIEVSQLAVNIFAPSVSEQRAMAFGNQGATGPRNTILIDEIDRAIRDGIGLVDLISKRIIGIRVVSAQGFEGNTCIEFRGPERLNQRCRPPAVVVDGAVATASPELLVQFPLTQLERIEVISPSEAGASYGPASVDGVILLKTRRGEFKRSVPVAHRTRGSQPSLDWNVESRPYPWARVYAAAFAGNALGLAVARQVAGGCFDLERRSVDHDRCSMEMLLGVGIVSTLIPPLGGSLGARLAGATDRSKGLIRHSVLASHLLFLPSIALVSVNHDPQAQTTRLDVAAFALMVAGAPLVNTLADKLFRKLR